MEPRLRPAELLERARGAELWLKRSRDGWASLPAQHELVLQLLEVGAPPAVVGHMQRAAVERLEVVLEALGLVELLAGEPLTPDPVGAVARTRPDGATEGSALANSLVARAVADTLVGLELELACAGAEEPFRSQTARMAELFSRQGELAWDALRALLDGGFIERNAVCAAIDGELARLGAVELDVETSRAAPARYGVADAAVRASVRGAGVELLVQVRSAV